MHDAGAPCGNGAAVDVAEPAGASAERAEPDAALTFDGFVQSHGRALIRCAYLVVGSRDAAQDVVQVALVKIARRWPQVVAGGDPLPYARTAVVRTAISWRRRKWHGERPHGEPVERAGTDGVEVVDSRDRLRRALATLPPRQRAAVVLRHYVDLDEATTARTLGCSVGTVKSQTSKGLAALRRALADPRPDPTR
jgi:RNA polymerase sigma-70 factor (sigma-E family)